MKSMKRILASLLALTALLAVTATGAQADLTGPPPTKPGK
jgi:predicted small lipoprotein YifL